MKRIEFTLAFTLAFVSLGAFASATHCLEKVARRADLERPDAWHSSGTCMIAYYNTCNDWVWVWSGWEHGDQIGVKYDTQDCAGASSGTVATTRMFVSTAAVSGRAFTGSIAVYEADEQGCPTNFLASQVWLPITGWNTYFWGVAVGPEFVIQGTVGDTSVQHSNPIGLPTDHPAAGATGPVGCGLCYPTTRAARSYYYGTRDSPICPGSPFDDGVCTAEFLWEVSMLEAPTWINDSAWGAIKGLYR